MRQISSRAGLVIELNKPIEVRTVRLGAKIEGMTTLLDLLSSSKGRKKPFLDIRANYSGSGLNFHRHFTTLDRSQPVHRTLENDIFTPITVPINHAELVIGAVFAVRQLGRVESYIHRVSNSGAQEMLVQYWNSVGHGDN